MTVVHSSLESEKLIHLPAFLFEILYACMCSEYVCVYSECMCVLCVTICVCVYCV